MSILVQLHRSIKTITNFCNFSYKKRNLVIIIVKWI